MSQDVKIPAHTFHKLRLNIERLGRQAELADMITEEEAAKLLGVKKRTMQVWASQHKLTGMFTVSPVNGSRHYFKTKLIGLKISL